jgi:hypothetical protein
MFHFCSNDDQLKGDAILKIRKTVNHTRAKNKNSTHFLSVDYVLLEALCVTKCSQKFLVHSL